MTAGLSRGSVWRRWDPHIHAPGTLFNDQFDGGEDALEAYVSAIEAARPKIEAIGVTDYYCTTTYQAIRNEWTLNRMPDVQLVFPNVELRLDIATVKGNWANIHLLVSPEDENHLDEVDRFLGRLEFEAHHDKFTCTRSELVRLGRKITPGLDEAAAFKLGASQFKVNLSKLRTEYRASDWAKKNILIAVAGSMTDGTSGVREAGDRTLRQEIESFAHVIFASSVAQREFWLGRKADPKAEIVARYGGLKPCLHGSDAHEQSTVANPEGDRFSWIKGEATFDALRQAVIDPEGRAYVGPQPPPTATPSQVIDKVAIDEAPWAKTPVIPLNAGLVAIIGARGSGKTALADIIAAGCGANAFQTARDGPSASFIARAGDLLRGSSVHLTWGSGGTAVHELTTVPDELTIPRARYLSQQFVEELCSSEGVTDALLAEIERVIFESHPPLERDGAIDFQELLSLRADRHRQARERDEDAIADLSERIGLEMDKDRQVPQLESAITQKTQAIAAYTADRARLVIPGSEARVARLTAITAAAEKVRGYLRHFATQEQALLSLADEVRDHRQNKAPEALRSRQERHAASRMEPQAWEDFRIDFTGDVDGQIQNHLKTCRDQATSWRGQAPARHSDPNTPYIADDADISRLPLVTLNAEIERLQGLVAIDTDTQRRFQELSNRIAQEGVALEAFKEKLEDAKGAKERARQLTSDRNNAYQRVFEALAAHEEVLRTLYKPLMERLAASSGTLSKLTFTVSRVADVGAFAKAAETDLLDLRKQGPFRGKGSLQAAVEFVLKPAWETGDPADVAAAMTTFRAQYQENLFEHAPVERATGEFRTWSRRLAKWLYGTDHIEITYGIDYDGIDIRKLSPGTRGIVLLLLYLALDDADDRPLIIDQPEENLDPKSVYDELVGLFIAAKAKRQVIMVTHNANLVVNTDADQVIVAEAGPHARGELPEITYRSGGLESAEIRKAVCDILEGGEEAFKERARRLRVRLPREA